MVVRTLRITIFTLFALIRSQFVSPTTHFELIKLFERPVMYKPNRFNYQLSFTFYTLYPKWHGLKDIYFAPIINRSFVMSVFFVNECRTFEHK